MSQITAITLTDGEAVPVPRVFKPAKKDGGLYEYHNRANGIAVGYDRLLVEHRMPSRQLKSTKTSYKLVLPTLEQTSASTASGIQPAPSKAYENLAKLEFVTAERSTKQERKNLLTMARDLINELIVAETVEDLDPPYF